MAVDSEGDSEVALSHTAQSRSSSVFPLHASAPPLICVRCVELIVSAGCAPTVCHIVCVGERGGILIQTNIVTCLYHSTQRTEMVIHCHHSPRP